MRGCELCENGGPLLCDTHSEHATIEREGRRDALAEHEKCSIECLMWAEETAVEILNRVISPREQAYHIGRRDALRELIKEKIE